MDFKRATAAFIAKIVNIGEEEAYKMIETPPNPAMGDYAFPCFFMAKIERKAPPMIAKDLAEKMNAAIEESDAKEFIGNISAVGGYVNFTVDLPYMAKNAISDAINLGDRFGSEDLGKGRNVCLDYSSINIAKPFHIGHLSTTVIGNSLCRIFKHLGYNTVSINHLGDWGTQFGKLIVAYKKWGDRKTVEDGSVSALMELYVKYHDEAEKDPTLDDLARAWFKKIEDKDEEATELFTWFKKITLESVAKIYELLDVKFDSYAGESFYTDLMPATVDLIREKGLLKIDDGASIVDLSDYNMPPCLILKRDGATLYATRDITTAIYRKNTYDFCKLLYVVAYQQDLHFKQFFKVLDLMGYDWVKDCVHVSYGMVSLEDGTLSTRHGKVVKLEDVLNAAIEKTLRVIEEKSPDLEDKETVAKQVGVGAVVWSPLYNNRIKDIVFSWEKALNFDGETGPYAQYTHARCCSVLKKAGVLDDERSLLDNIDYTLVCDDESSALIKSIAAFPDTIKAAADKYEPYMIARRVIDICGKFNRFYYEHHIMTDDVRVQNARLALTAAARSAIKTGLYLLGLSAPVRM